jgi:hypothetical protein
MLRRLRIYPEHWTFVHRNGFKFSNYATIFPRPAPERPDTRGEVGTLFAPLEPTVTRMLIVRYYLNY